MIDISTHTFKTNNKGLIWLLFMTAPAIAILLLWVYMLMNTNSWEFEIILAFIALSAIMLYGFIMFYADWVSFLFARKTTLEINMQTNEFTYKHERETIKFKPVDVAHWYSDAGFWLSRVATHHTIIVLKSGKELFIPMWLFEGNRFLMSNDVSYNTFNASYFILSVKDGMCFPSPEEAPNRYKYILPPEVVSEYFHKY